MKKVAIVTGGTRGIGFAIAKALLENEYKVVINYCRDETKAKEALKALEKFSDHVMAIQSDITTETGRDTLVQKALDSFGDITLLVNNAGVAGRYTFLKDSEESFQHIIQSNLTGAVFLAQRVAQHMIERKVAGSIINICSTASYSATSGSLAYCAAKAGLLIATKNMAAIMGPHGIRVNSITPGGIETDMSRHAWQDPSRGPALEKTIPLRRRGQPSEIAGAVLYLASEHASYTTGADMIIDGGWMLRTGSN